MSMWDEFGKGYDAGSALGNKVSRRRALKKEKQLREDLKNNPDYAGNEIALNRAYEEGVADLTRAAEARGLPIRQELLERWGQERGREGVRQQGERTLGLPVGGRAAPIAPTEGAAPLGAAPIAPAAGGVPPMAAPPPGAPSPLPSSTPPGARPMGRAAPDFRGAADTAAQFGYAGGDATAGAAAAQQGRNIDIAQGAMDVDPMTGERRFNQATAARGMRDDSAGRGDIAGAAQAQNVGTTAAQQLSSHFFSMASQELNQDNPSKDRIEAAIREGAKYNPALGIDSAVYDPEKKTIDFMRGSDSVHQQDVGSDQGKEQAMFLMERYSKDPGEATKSFLDSRRAEITAEKEESSRFRGKIEDKVLEAFKDFQSDPRGKMESALTEVSKLSGGGGKGTGGFSVEKLDLEGPSTFAIDGKIYTLTRVDEDTKLPPGVKYTPNMLLVQDEKGNSTTLERAGLKQEIATQLTQVMTDAFKANGLQRGADLKFLLNSYSDLYRGAGGTANITGGRGGRGGEGGEGGTAAPPTDAKAIQQDYEDAGKKHGFTISSMERPVMKGVGAGERSQHPKGTAVDYSVKGKSKEEGDALIADLQSRGYQVVDERDGKTGTGPHIHAELPPGGLAGSPAQQPSTAQEPSAAPQPSPTPQPSPAPAADVPPTGEPPPSPMTRKLADPATHKANAERARAAATAYRDTKESFESFADDMNSKYGPAMLERMSPAERGTLAELQSDFAAARQEASDATRLAETQAGGFRKLQAGQASQEEQAALLAQYRDKSKGAGAPAEESTPREFRGPAPSQGFFAKYLKSGYK